MANLPHLGARTHTHVLPPPPPPPLGLSSWMIFDESRSRWSRNPQDPEQHLCSVWQASCVIYDSVMREHSGQLDKGYSSKWDQRDSCWHRMTRVEVLDLVTEVLLVDGIRRRDQIAKLLKLKIQTRISVTELLWHMISSSSFQCWLTIAAVWGSELALYSA